MSLPLFRPLRFADHALVSPIPAASGRVDASTLAVDGAVAGYVLELDALRSCTFAPRDVHPRIRHFLASSRGHSKTMMEARWEPWARALAWLYSPLAEHLGNLRVPERRDEPVSIKSDVRRAGADRIVTRTMRGSGRLFYTAALRSGVTDDGRASCMAMTFPFPRANLLVVLRLCNDGDGLVATTGAPGGGTYGILPRGDRFVALPGPPTEETLTFRVEGGSVRVCHEDYLLGRRAFTIDYRVDFDDAIARASAA